MEVENIHPTFLDLFLGNMHIAEWLFCSFLMMLGVLLYILLRIKNRTNQERKKSLNYYVSREHNLIAVATSIILTYILIRFYSNYQQAILNVLPEGFEMTQYFTMIVVGFAQHRISEWVGKQAKTL